MSRKVLACLVLSLAISRAFALDLVATWGSTNFRHADGVLALDVRGDRLASGGKDGAVRLWKRTGEELEALPAGAGWVLAVALSPDARRVAWGGWDGAVRVHELGRPVSEVAEVGRLPDWVQSVAWSPDGTRLAAAARDSSSLVWDGKEARKSEGHASAAGAVAWSADGARLAVTADAGTRVERLAAGERTLEHTLPMHPGGTTRLAFLPDGALLSAGTDGDLACWDPATGKSRWRVHAQPAGVAALAVSPDGAQAATAGGDDTLRTFDIKRGQGLAQLDQPDRAHALAFAGERLLMGLESGAIAERDLAARAAPATRGGIVCLTVSPDGKTVAASTTARDVQLGDAGTGAFHALALHPELVRTLCWLPGGGLAAGGDDAQVELLDPAGGKARVLGPHSPWVTALAASPDGKTLLSGAGNAVVKIWDLTSSKETGQLTGHQAQISGLAWVEGDRALTACRDYRIALWSVPERKALATLKGHKGAITALAATPDGKSALSGGENGELLAWAPPDETPVAHLREPGGSAVSALLISKGGERAVVAYASGEVELRAWPSGAIQGHVMLTGLDHPTALSWLADGRLLVGTARGAVQVYR